MREYSRVQCGPRGFPQPIFILSHYPLFSIVYLNKERTAICDSSFYLTWHGFFLNKALSQLLYLTIYHRNKYPCSCRGLIGDEYGIRTRECMRERHVS